MSAHPLPGVFGTLAPLLDHYGLLAVAFLIFLENVGVPVVPGETMLIAAAVYAGAGRLNIVEVGVVALVTAVAGSAGGYAIGRYGGRTLALRYGKYAFLTGERLTRAEKFFTSRGGVVVSLARFIEGLRQANGIIAGIAEMGWIRFLSYNAAGAVLWVGVWSSVGYLAGDHIDAIYDDITRYLLYVLIAVAAVIAVLVVRSVLNRRRRAAEQHEAGEREAPVGKP